MTIRLDWLRGAALALALAATRCSAAGPSTSDGTGGSSVVSTGGTPNTGGSGLSTTGGTLGSSGGSLSAGGAVSTLSGGNVGMGGAGATTGGQSPGSSGGNAGGGAGGSSSAGTGASGSSGAGGAATGGAGTGGAPSNAGSSAGGKSTGGAAASGGGGGAGGKSTGGAATTGGQPAGGSGSLSNLTVYLAGDSTVSTYTNSAIDQAGWGQFLQTYLDAKAKVDNRAIGGRTARRFIDEGYLDKILQVIKAGDYLLVQFGTNDGNQTATYTFNGQSIPYYLAPATDFKTWMTQYVVAAREKQANPVFVTPPPRRSCTGDSHSFGNGLAGYATAMKEMGAAQNVPVVDLNLKTLTHLNTIGCIAAGTDFFLVNADGSVDGTHFQEKGANLMAGFVAAGLRELNFGLTPYVK